MVAQGRTPFYPLKTLFRDFGSYWRDSIKQLLQSCWLHIHYANLSFHHIPKLLCQTALHHHTTTSHAFMLHAPNLYPSQRNNKTIKTHQIIQQVSNVLLSTLGEPMSAAVSHLFSICSSAYFDFKGWLFDLLWPYYLLKGVWLFPSHL